MGFNRNRIPRLLLYAYIDCFNGPPILLREPSALPVSVRVADDGLKPGVERSGTPGIKSHIGKPAERATAPDSLFIRRQAWKSKLGRLTKMFPREGEHGLRRKPAQGFREDSRLAGWVAWLKAPKFAWRDWVAPHGSRRGAKELFMALRASAGLRSGGPVGIGTAEDTSETDSN